MVIGKIMQVCNIRQFRIFFVFIFIYRIDSDQHRYPLFHMRLAHLLECEANMYVVI